MDPDRDVRPPEIEWSPRKRNYTPPHAPGHGCLLPVAIFAGLVLAAVIAWPLSALVGLRPLVAFSLGLLVVIGLMWARVRWRRNG